MMFVSYLEDRARHQTAHAPRIPSCSSYGCPGAGTSGNPCLDFEEFIPARSLPGGRQRPASAAYTCARCGRYARHDVPAGWTPPDWPRHA